MTAAQGASGELAVRFALVALAAWRITHLLAAEDGPGEVIFRLRRALGQGGWLASLADCFNCLSLFVAAPLALFVSTRPALWALAWLAASGAACLLERTSGQTHPFVQPMIQPLEGDADVLWRETLEPGPDPTASALGAARAPAAGRSPG